MEAYKDHSTLYAFLDGSKCFQTDHGRSKKECLISSLQNSLTQWTLQVEKSKDKKVIGRLHLFGSFSLGISHEDGDIDCIALFDNNVTQEEFFTSWYQFLISNHNTTNARKVETAVVPLIKITIDNIEVDMLFACLNRPGVVDILPFDDTSLASLDSTTVRVLNGYRETEILAKVTPNFEAFKVVTIAVKLWIKRKQLYGDILGSLPGICCSIMVSYVCQQYPDASPEQLLLQYFKTFSQWDWQRPVLLRPLQPNTLELNQWNPAVRRVHEQEKMQVITPAYPEHNVTSVLSVGTFHMFQVRLKEAVATCESCILGSASWSQLFSPATDFFTSFKTFLMVTASATGEQHKLDWLGLVGSRVFILENQLSQEPSLDLCWLLPRTFHQHDTVTDVYTDRWFIGLQPNAEVPQKLNVSSSVQHFLNIVQDKGQKSFLNTEDMTVEVAHIKRGNVKALMSDEEADFFEL